MMTFFAWAFKKFDSVCWPQYSHRTLPLFVKIGLFMYCALSYESRALADTPPAEAVQATTPTSSTKSETPLHIDVDLGLEPTLSEKPLLSTPLSAPVLDATLPWFDDLLINAFISTSWVQNLRYPNAVILTNQARYLDVFNNGLNIDLAQLVLQMLPEAPGQAGFYLEMLHGMLAPFALGGRDIFLQQAYISYIPPILQGLRVDVGSFASLIGSEVVMGYDNFNDFYSNGLLFAFGLPKILTGLRLQYVFDPRAVLNLFAVNGWSHNLRDNNSGKSFGAQLHLTPHPAFALHVHYLAGPEQLDNNHDIRQLLDATAMITIAPLTLTLEALIGQDNNSSSVKTHIPWSGYLAALRWDINHTWAMAVRGEYFDDSAGFANFNAKLADITFTPGVKITDNALLRAEFRYDWAFNDVELFGPVDTQHTDQMTVAANLLMVF